MYQRTDRPETLFGHIFGEAEGYLVAFTGQQARFSRPDARPNELSDTRQRSFIYPDEAAKAAAYLLSEASPERRRDAYVGVHLFREPGNRLASNARPTVRALWLDEDEGRFPEAGPQPTAIVASSAARRHLYWRLTQEVAAGWAVAMTRRIATWAAGDIGKAGLASVLRVPGTMNYKRLPQVDPVTIEITEAGPWEPGVLEQAIPQIPEPLPGRARAPSRRPATGPYDGPEVELAEYLANVELVGELPDGLGVKFAIVCPWADEHSGGDRTGTRVGRRASGGPWFHCDHEHCQGRGWAEFRRRVPRRGSIIVTPPRNTKPEGRVVIRLG